MLTFIEDLEELEVQISQEAALISDSQNILIDAYKQITSIGGIDRDIGMSIARAVPSMEAVTPNMFTQFPTKTSLTVAMEGFWSGIAEGITKVFELIFSLILGVLKLLFKPLEWLLGIGSDSKGATAASASRVKAMTNPEVGKLVNELSTKEKNSVAAAVLENVTFSDWDMRFLKSTDFSLFASINKYTEEMYEIILTSTDKFLKDFDSLDASYASVVNLMKSGHEANSRVSEVSTKFFKDLSKLQITVPDTSNILEVTKTYVTLKSEIERLESIEVPKALATKFYESRLETFKEYVEDLGDSIDFSKSDEEVYNATDKYTAKYQRQADKFKRVMDTDFEALGLSSEEINEVKGTVNSFMVTIRLALDAVKSQSLISIKGKRAIFKGVAAFSRMTVGLKKKFDTLEDFQKAMESDEPLEL